MALTKAQAEQRVLDYLRSLHRYADFEVVLLDDDTIEKPFGWVFFWDSKATSRPENFETRLPETLRSW